VCELHRFGFLHVESGVEDLIVEECITSAALDSGTVIFERRIVNPKTIERLRGFDSNDLSSVLGQMLSNKRTRSEGAKFDDT